MLTARLSPSHTFTPLPQDGEKVKRRQVVSLVGDEDRLTGKAKASCASNAK